MKQSGIYRIWIGDCFYFGQGQALKKREQSHRSLLRRGKHNNVYLQRAFDKYECFFFEKLVGVCVDDLTAVEQALIDEYAGDPQCMNIARDACAPGRNPSPETRAKMSASRTGLVHSAEHRAKNSAANRGRKLSPEHREKVRQARTGTTRSLETRAKISAANRKRKMSTEHRAAILAANTGRVCSPETRARISQANRQRWARVKGPTSHESTETPTTKKES